MRRYVILGEWPSYLAGDTRPRQIEIEEDMTGEPAVTATVWDESTGAIIASAAACQTTVLSTSPPLSTITWQPQAADVASPGRYTLIFNASIGGSTIPIGKFRFTLDSYGPAMS